MEGARQAKAAKRIGAQKRRKRRKQPASEKQELPSPASTPLFTPLPPPPSLFLPSFPFLFSFPSFFLSDPIHRGFANRDMPSVEMAAWRISGIRQALGAWRKKSQGLTDDPRASDQPLALVVRRSNQRLHLNWSSGWVHTPRTSSLARSASPRTALKAGVDALPYSLFLFLHFVLPGSSSVSRCSRSSEEYLIPVHSGRKRPRLLPSSLQIPASEQRPFSSRRCL